MTVDPTRHPGSEITHDSRSDREPQAAAVDRLPAATRDLTARGADPLIDDSPRHADDSRRPSARTTADWAGPDTGGGAARWLLRLVRRQEFAFAIVGVVNTVMGIGLTIAWLAVLGDSVPPSAGVAAAYATGIGIAFVLHRYLVFRVRGRVIRDFLGFAAVNCGGLFANAALLELAVTVLGFPRAPAAVVVMGAVAAGTYFGHRYISFHRPVV